MYAPLCIYAGDTPLLGHLLVVARKVADQLGLIPNQGLSHGRGHPPRVPPSSEEEFQLSSQLTVSPTSHFQSPGTPSILRSEPNVGGLSPGVQPSSQISVFSPWFPGISNKLTQAGMPSLSMYKGGQKILYGKAPYKKSFDFVYFLTIFLQFLYFLKDFIVFFLFPGFSRRRQQRIYEIYSRNYNLF